MAIDARQLGGTTIRKIAVITSSQNWVVPPGLVGDKIWLTGCAAGGSGGQVAAGGFACGGFGGAYCEQLPVPVTAGATYAVVIPAGGAAQSSGNGNSGGDLTFGSLLTIKGGRGGRSQSGTGATIAQFLDFVSCSGVKPNVFISSTVAGLGVASIAADTVNGNVAGASNTAAASCTGGAAGLFGNGTAATNNTAAAAADANSGAGGGASTNTSGVSGAGGSGKLIIEWDEFL